MRLPKLAYIFPAAVAMAAISSAPADAQQTQERESYNEEDVEILLTTSCTKDNYSLETHMHLAPSINDIERLASESDTDPLEIKAAFFEVAAALYGEALDFSIGRFSVEGVSEEAQTSGFLNVLENQVDRYLEELEIRTGITPFNLDGPHPESEPVQGCTPD